MKRSILILLVVPFLYTSCQQTTNKKTEILKNVPMELTKFETIKLQEPNIQSGVPLMTALSGRKSDRKFAEENLSLKHLSEILWAAYGRNRDDGKRTVPSAASLYPLKVYAVLANGVYLYNPDIHELEPVLEGDFRKLASMQDWAHNAPLNLVFIADYTRYKTGNPQLDGMLEKTKERFAALDAGNCTQSVGLYCASEGLKGVVRGSVTPELLQKLEPEDNQEFIVAMTIGY